VSVDSSFIRGRFGSWLKGARLQQHRFVDDLECVLSVLLAILLAHAVGAHNVSWAAFSGYMVMRGHVSDSFVRGVLRVVGTSLGAGLALLVVPAVSAVWLAPMIAASVVGGLSLYGAMTGRRSYAWLFAGLTFEMILLDKLEHPQIDVTAFARTRFLDVLAGTVACVVVSTLSTLTARRLWPGSRAAAAKRIAWHPAALRHSLQASAALALLPLLWFVFGIPQLAQGAVSIMAVMLVPITSLGKSGLAPVTRKLIQRVAGCLAGSALAGVFLLIAGGNPTVLLAGTILGVALGRHIENGAHSVTYVGTQFTLAVLVTLVPDTYAHAAIAPAGERLIGILVGLAVIEPVLVGSHLISTRIAMRNRII
jgi:uncharacterized membrane protein YccC